MATMPHLEINFAIIDADKLLAEMRETLARSERWNRTANWTFAYAVVIFVGTAAYAYLRFGVFA